MYTHVHTCTHMYTQLHTFTHLYTHLHMYTHLHTFTHSHIKAITFQNKISRHVLVILQTFKCRSWIKFSVSCVRVEVEPEAGFSGTPSFLGRSENQSDFLMEQKPSGSSLSFFQKLLPSDGTKMWFSIVHGGFGS